MKNSVKILIGIGVLILITIFSLTGTYNNLVELDENVEQAWSDVETQYQRRLDLFNNLVNTIKGSAEFERETLESVINARARATSVNIDANNLTQEKLQEFQEAQQGLSSAFSRLLLVAERYPELKTTSQFQALQAQIEGTENRITKARQDFNDAARVYNVRTKRFPTNIVAGLFGFDPVPYFEAEEGTERAPVIDFDS